MNSSETTTARKDIAFLKKAHNAASPGPWLIEEDHDNNAVYLTTLAGDSRIDAKEWHRFVSCYGSEAHSEAGEHVSFANARFIATAHDMIPKLAERIEKADAVIIKMMALLQGERLTGSSINDVISEAEGFLNAR